VKKCNSSRTSKWTSILHTPSNSPSKPPLLEALHYPLQTVGPTILFFLPLLIPSLSPFRKAATATASSARAQARLPAHIRPHRRTIFVAWVRYVSGIHPGYSCKEGGRVEDGLLLEFPCTPTRTRSV
jgi:hypothetical protein